MARRTASSYGQTQRWVRNTRQARRNCSVPNLRRRGWRRTSTSCHVSAVGNEAPPIIGSGIAALIVRTRTSASHATVSGSKTLSAGTSGASSSSASDSSSSSAARENRRETCWFYAGAVRHRSGHSVAMRGPRRRAKRRRAEEDRYAQPKPVAKPGD